MLATIVVPVYNAEKYLVDCIDSIRAQTIRDFECLLIDDGSTDSSYSICELFIKVDKRFKLIKKYNSGPADCRNIGIELAQGKYICFVDSDDTVYPNKLEKCIEMFKANPEIKFVQHALTVKKEDGSKKRWDLGKEKRIFNLKDNIILSNIKYDIGHSPDKMYLTSFLKEQSHKFAKCAFCEDLIFNLSLFVKEQKIGYIPDELYTYYIRTGSLCHKDTITKTSTLIAANQMLQRNNMLNNKNFGSMVSVVEKAITSRDKYGIDYVFPYVDSSDPGWIALHNKYSSSKKEFVDSLERFRDTNLLKYKFRSIEKYMPWIDTIHIVVQSPSQVPDWLNTDLINVVYHSDIVPIECLPLFNSSALEMFMQNIFGLSERFIYSNDDMICNAPMICNDFFPSEGKINMKIKGFQKEGRSESFSDYDNLLEHDFKLASNKIKCNLDSSLLYECPHIDRPMLRSNNIEVFNKNSKEIMNSISKFRDPKNYSQGIFNEYAYLRGKTVDQYIKYNYRVVGRDNAAIKNDLNDTSIKMICLNDTGYDIDYFKDIEKSLIKKFPNKSKYEI